jgi:adenine-specific DNA-methyltransferase
MDFGASSSLSDERFDCLLDETNCEAWRPIHYLGSKLRALEALEDAISRLSPHGSHMCDLFAGSGTVANYFARTRPVTAVDIQEYSRVICDALLCPPSAWSVRSLEDDLESRIAASAKVGVVKAAGPLIGLEARAMELAARGECHLLASLVEAGSILTAQRDAALPEIIQAMDETGARLRTMSGVRGLASMTLRHFGGSYFSFKQAAEMDVLLDFAHSAEPRMRSTLIAAVLSTASELVNTVGKHFAQPIRPRDKHGKIKSTLHSIVARDRDKPVLRTFIGMLERYMSAGSSHFENQVLRADYSDFLRSPHFDAEIVYADPPYTRDHYSRFYHVLETLALRDDPKISTNTAHGRTLPSRGVYRTERHQSPFCIRSEAPAAFDELFRFVAARSVPLVLSYSPYASEKNAHPRVMTMDGITDLAKRHFKRVDVESVGTFSHSRLNRSGLNKDISYEAEYLLLCQV